MREMLAATAGVPTHRRLMHRNYRIFGLTGTATCVIQQLELPGCIVVRPGQENEISSDSFRLDYSLQQRFLTNQRMELTCTHRLLGDTW